MEKNRLEAFSDGVLAIIITIMVLELKQPISDGWKDIFSLWPTLLTYLISFFFIAIYWVNHHIIFHISEKINVKILWCNIVWLFVMSFIPFTTSWAGSYPTSWAPLCIYFADMSLACFTFHQMYYLIVKEKGEEFKLSVRSIISMIVYLGAAVLGGFSPYVAYVLVAIVSFWWIIPEKHRGKKSDD